MLVTNYNAKYLILCKFYFSKHLNFIEIRKKISIMNFKTHIKFIKIIKLYCLSILNFTN